MNEQMVEQALNSMKVGKAPGPTGVTSNLVIYRLQEQLELKGSFRFVNPLNRKARLQ